MGKMESTLLCSVLATLCCLSSAAVTFQGGGFDNLFVAIGEDIPETSAEVLLKEVKKLLEETSEALHRASFQSAFIRSVQILIPATWTNTTFDLQGSGLSFQEADIRVAPSNPIYGHQPYTLQTGLCGEEGLFIHLTPQYVTSSEVSRAWGDRGKLLAKEWAKYRWGVFEERGFLFDPLFPLVTKSAPHSNSYDANVCSNRQLSIDMSDVSGCTATTLSEGDSIRCSRFLLNNVNGANSSITGAHFLQGVDYFCTKEGPHNHSVKVTTLQNLRCQGRSSWEVITASKDFQGKSPMAVSRVATTFTVKRLPTSSSSSIAIVLDMSNKMTINHRLRKVLWPLQQFLFEDIEEGTSVTIVTFCSLAKVALKLKPLTSQEDRQEVNSILQKVATCSYSCIGCGLRTAKREALRGVEDATIILITTPKEDYGPFVSEVTQEMILSQFPVNVNVIGGDNENLKALADGTKGIYTTIKDDSLSSSLRRSLRNTYVSPQRENIFVQQYEGTMNSISQEFRVDTSVYTKLIFTFETQDGGLVTSDPQLRSPSGSPVEMKFGGMNTARATTTDVQVGVWNFEVSLSENGTFVGLLAVAGSKTVEKKDAWNIEAWLNRPGEVVNPATDVLVIFALITYSGKPVINMSPEGVVYLDTNSKEPFGNVVLYDTGTGCDVTANDGFYCNYFTELTMPGTFSVWVSTSAEGKAFSIDSRNQRYDQTYSDLTSAAINYCCGSSTPLAKYTTSEKTGPVALKATGKFTVRSPLNPSSDSSPPGWIMDLRAHLSSASEVQLTWTATGDDDNEGTASSYAFRMDSNPIELYRKDFGLRSSGVRVASNPAWTSGSLASYSLPLETPLKEDEMYYVTAKAVDDSSNMGPMSNLASFVWNEKSLPQGSTREIVSASGSSASGSSASGSSSSGSSSSGSSASGAQLDTAPLSKGKDDAASVRGGLGVLATTIGFCLILTF